MCRGLLAESCGMGAEKWSLQGREPGLEWPRALGDLSLQWVGCGALGSIGPGTLLGVLIKAKEDQPTGVQPVNQAELCLGQIWGFADRPHSEAARDCRGHSQGNQPTECHVCLSGSPWQPPLWLCPLLVLWPARCPCPQHPEQRKPAPHDLQPLPTCAGTRL